MNYHLLIDNLTNPALLFFILGIIAVLVKSDLEIPPNSSKFISLYYLLFAIGFKGGQELSHETFNAEIAASMLFGIGISMGVPTLHLLFIKKTTQPIQCSCHCGGLRIGKRGNIRNCSILSGNTTFTITRPYGSHNGAHGISSHYRWPFITHFE